MISFDWPWLFALIPLPFLLRWILRPAAVAEDAALRVPQLAPFVMTGAMQTAGLKRRPWRMLIAFIAWLSLVTAAASPVWFGDAVELPVSGREMMLAVDLSGSMQTQDFTLGRNQVNRLQAIKAVAGEFIHRRVGDRIGLILFGSQAYVQTPLSFDRKTVNGLLQESAIGLAGDQTAIGDAIGLATKRLYQNPDGNKVLILLTDGASNAGEIEPIRAAELAAKQGMTIYTIGVGAESMEVSSFFGSQRVNPSADLDEQTLTAIAKATGGRYFRARDSAELNQIYTMLDELQPVEQETQTFRPQQSLFYWPLSLAVLLAAMLLLWRALRGD